MRRNHTRTLLSTAVMILCTTVSAWCAPATIHATGESAMSLSAGIDASKIEAVAMYRDKQYVPVDFSLKNAQLLITPCRDIEAGLTYDVKVFTTDGKRHVLKAVVEEYPPVILAKERIIEVRPKRSKGFNYAYYVYVPEGAEKLKDRRLLVQCVNTSSSSIQQWIDGEAKKQAWHGYVQILGRRLQVPCMVPAFPRDAHENNDDYVYAQFLDRGAVQQTRSGPNAKIDRQMIAMIKDARQLLAKIGIDVPERIFITGYSADAKFAQRFTILHPELVMAAAPGGISALATFPMTEYQGEKLDYPIGIADLKGLSGTDFNPAEFAKVPQFFHMGEKDENDAVPYPDCYPKQDADQIYRLFGEKQMPDRWAVTQKILAKCCPQIQCKTDPGLGHDITDYVVDEVVAFFTAHWSR